MVCGKRGSGADAGTERYQRRGGKPQLPASSDSGKPVSDTDDFRRAFVIADYGFRKFFNQADRRLCTPDLLFV